MTRVWPQGHPLKIVLARTRNKTVELPDRAATRELADSEHVGLLEWAYANRLRLIEDHSEGLTGLGAYALYLQLTTQLTI